MKGIDQKKADMKEVLDSVLIVMCICYAKKFIALVVEHNLEQKEKLNEVRNHLKRV